MSRTSMVILGGFSAFLAVMPAIGSDLAINGSFDADIRGWTPPTSTDGTVGLDNASGWTPRTPTEGAAAWDSLDVDGSPLSGSLRLTNSGPAPSVALSTRCVPATGGLAYNLGAMIFIPAGQTGSGFASVDVRWKETGDCTGTDLGGAATTVAGSTGSWQSETGSHVTAPAGTLGARIRLLAYKTTIGGELAAHFDDVFLGDSEIFSDGFETGDTSAWSSVFPPDLPPDVNSISPVDGALHVAALTPVAVTFSEPMNPATITANTVNTACSGTLQLSANGFSSCVQLAAQPATSDNTTFTVSPLVALASAATYKVRVTTDAQDSTGNPLTAVYTTAIGFRVRYSHPIVVDGSNDFSPADEELATSTTPARLFVSYDDLTLYVALEHPDVVIGGTGSKFTYFLFSTDASLAAGNTASSDGMALFGAAGTSRMLYHWKERIDGGTYSEFRIANGADWNTDWGPGGKSVFKADGYVEASFALTEFGGIAPADLFITAYTVDYDGAGGDGWVYNMLDGATDGTGSPPRPLSGYLHLQLPSSFSPNDAANLGSF